MAEVKLHGVKKSFDEVEVIHGVDLEIKDQVSKLSLSAGVERDAGWSYGCLLYTSDAADE